MKSDIHPKWFPEAAVACACGNRFTVGSTKAELKVEICNKCHPFFTGEMRYVDTLGHVERFQQKQAKAKVSAVTLALKKKKKAEHDEQLRQPKSLKDMLMSLK